MRRFSSRFYTNSRSSAIIQIHSWTIITLAFFFYLRRECCSSIKIHSSYFYSSLLLFWRVRKLDQIRSFRILVNTIEVFLSQRSRLKTLLFLLIRQLLLGSKISIILLAIRLDCLSSSLKVKHIKYSMMSFCHSSNWASWWIEFLFTDRLILSSRWADLL